MDHISIEKLRGMNLVCCVPLFGNYRINAMQKVYQKLEGYHISPWSPIERMERATRPGYRNIISTLKVTSNTKIMAAYWNGVLKNHVNIVCVKERYIMWLVFGGDVLFTFVENWGDHHWCSCGSGSGRGLAWIISLMDLYMCVCVLGRVL